MNGSRDEVVITSRNADRGDSPSEDRIELLEAETWTREFAQPDGERTSIDTELGSVHSQRQSDRLDLKRLDHIELAPIHIRTS